MALKPRCRLTTGLRTSLHAMFKDDAMAWKSPLVDVIGNADSKQTTRVLQERTALALSVHLESRP